MTDASEPLGGATAALVRRCLRGLAVISMLATAFELATERHWHGFEQLVPWLTLVVLVTATMLALLPGRPARTAARLLVILVLAATIYGVLDHIAVNYNSGVLDQRFAETWETLPSWQRWWYALTKTVGPAPTLAPGVLGLSAVLLLLASLIVTPSRRSRSPSPRPR